MTTTLTNTDNVNIIRLSRNIKSSNGSNVWMSTSDFKNGLLQDITPKLDILISVAPIWKIEEYFPILESYECKKIVCLSSTSRFTKTNTSNAYEEKVVNDLIQGELDLQAWAANNNVNWTILRPTLIYGHGTDKNLSEIAKIINKLKFFPLFGNAGGLRQPIHVDDVAKASVLAAFNPIASNKAYNISGAEIITYKEMVVRVFEAMDLRPKFFTINLPLFNFGLFFLKKIPRYKNWNGNMIQRMNADMVFDHQEAQHDFGFEPRRFILTSDDVRISV